MSAQIGVVGAGAAGLAAAHTLVRAGARVTLFDRAARPGGLLRTEMLGGARVDVGVQLVSSTQTSLRALAQQAGADALLRRTPGRDALWRRERAHPITYGSVASMLTSGALPTRLKLRLGARYLPYLAAHARHLDANDLPGSGGAALDGETIGAWGLRELGDDFVELLVYPLLAAYYGAEPERTSAAVYHALAREGMDVSVYASAGGFGALADALAAAVTASGGQCAWGTEAQHIAPAHDGVRVRTSAGEQVFDAVVVAVPGNRVAALLDAAPELCAWLERVVVQPTITVALRVDRAFPGDYFGLSFPRGSATGETVAALCIQSRKLPGLVPDGDALVALPAPAATRQLLAMSDDDVIRTQVRALEAAVTGIGTRVTGAGVYRLADGYTVFDVGYIGHLAAFRSSWLPPRLALAGAYLTAPSLEGAVRSGVRAAQRVLAAEARG